VKPIFFPLVIMTSLAVCNSSFASPTDNAHFATSLFLDSCAKNYGNNTATSQWAKSKLSRAKPSFEQAVLNGKTGEVWGVAGNYILVLSEGNSCAVWARVADADTVNANVVKLVNKIARPGIVAKPFIDKISDGIGGTYRQYGFILQTPNSSSGMAILSTTSKSEAAEVQARITLTPAKL